MRIQVDLVTAPAHWAPALVNGDSSGMNESEIAAMESWLNGLGGWRVVDIGRDIDGAPMESRFTWQFPSYGGTAQGGDILEYVVHKTGRA